MSAPNGTTFRPIRATRSASAASYAVAWWGEFAGIVDSPRATGRPGWSFRPPAGLDPLPVEARALYPTRGDAAAGLLRHTGRILEAAS